MRLKICTRVSRSVVPFWRRRLFARRSAGGIRGCRRGCRGRRKNPPEQRADAAQPAKVEGAPERIVGLAEIEHEEASVGPGDALHFAQAQFPVGQVAQTVADGDEVERVVGKGNLLGVAAEELGRRAAGGGERDRFSATASMGSQKSRPVTRIPRRARAKATSPVPQQRSRARSPGRPAASLRRRRFQWRCRPRLWRSLMRS